MALYARGFDAGFPRKPMILPAFSDPKYEEIRTWIQDSFKRLGLTYESGDFKVTA